MCTGSESTQACALDAFLLVPCWAMPSTASINVSNWRSAMSRLRHISTTLWINILVLLSFFFIFLWPSKWAYALPCCTWHRTHWTKTQVQGMTGPQYHSWMRMGDSKTLLMSSMWIMCYSGSSTGCQCRILVWGLQQSSVQLLQAYLLPVVLLSGLQHCTPEV